jgi:hypothetical protein
MPATPDHTQAFERAYPNLRKQQQLGRSASEAFSNITHTGLVLQLNCLTVPGPALKYRDLRPGRVLKTAGVGALQVVSSGCVGGLGQLWVCHVGDLQAACQGVWPQD